MNNDASKRRIVIIASPAKLKELEDQIDWKKVAIKTTKSSVFTSLLPVISIVSPLLGLPLIAYNVLSSKKDIPFPVFDFNTVRNEFLFPVNHPVDGQVYACCEAEPNHYVPVALFHQHMYESKMSAFHELCADLGAKTCKVYYAEENGKEIAGNISVTNVPTNAGPISGEAELSFKSNSSNNADIYAEYPQPKGPPKESSSRWMDGENTWRSMKERRLKNGVEKFRAEFTYNDEMGINAKIAGSMAKVGLSIGGAYEEMCKRKWIFDVEFWPR